jgi:hypothetical protein
MLLIFISRNLSKLEKELNKGDEMNLYLVTCVSKGHLSNSTYDVYVVAGDSNQAGEKALNKMRQLKYAYTDFVEKIVLLASIVAYQAPDLLVI